MTQLFVLIFDCLADAVHPVLKNPNNFPFLMQSFSNVHCISTCTRHLSLSMNTNMAPFTCKGLALLWNSVHHYFFASYNDLLMVEQYANSSNSVMSALEFNHFG